MTGGVRYENTRVKVEDFQTLYGYGITDKDENKYGQVDVIGGEQKFNQALYNAGAVYTLTDEVNVFAGFNQGFGLPDIGRVLRGNWIGDQGQNVGGGPSIDFNDMPAVAPVVTDNYEIGINYTSDRLQMAASTYYSLAKDGANLSLNTGGTYDVVRQRTEIKGAEATAKYLVNDKLSLQALYSVVRGEVDNTGDGKVDSKMDLKNLSPDRFMVAANYEFTENASGHIQVNTLMDSKNATAKQDFKGYSLVDISFKYDLQKYGRLSFAVENLMDKFYVGYYSQIRNHSSYYFSGRGRTYSVNYEIDF